MVERALLHPFALPTRSKKVSSESRTRDRATHHVAGSARFEQRAAKWNVARLRASRGDRTRSSGTGNLIALPDGKRFLKYRKLVKKWPGDCVIGPALSHARVISSCGEFDYQTTNFMFPHKKRQKK
jgi:hypothetical protein